MIEFPDVSHYQAGLSLTGAVAVVAKATQGTSYVDRTFGDFRRQASTMGIPFSGYHWVDGTDPAAQARWYHDHSAGAPCMWDAEAEGATVPRLVAATAALRALGGHAWGAYLPHWWWAGHLGGPDLRPLVAAGLVLVSSNYRTTPPGAGWLPYGGVTPTVWQYTSSQPFNGMSCDFNRYQGTATDLAALFAGTPTFAPDHGKGTDVPVFAHCAENGGYYSYPGPKWYTSEAAVSAGLAAHGMTRGQIVEFPTLDGIRDALGSIPGVDVPADGHGNPVAASGPTDGIASGESVTVTGVIARAPAADQQCTWEVD